MRLNVQCLHEMKVCTVDVLNGLPGVVRQISARFKRDIQHLSLIVYNPHGVQPNLFAIDSIDDLHHGDTIEAHPTTTSSGSGHSASHSPSAQQSGKPTPSPNPALAPNAPTQPSIKQEELEEPKYERGTKVQKVGEAGWEHGEITHVDEEGYTIQYHDTKSVENPTYSRLITLLETSSPIAKDDVAAGDGALHTLTKFSFSRI